MITKYIEICAICGKPKEHTHHLLYGKGIRPLADQDKLTIPLCHECHDAIHRNAVAGQLSKIIGQLAWEKEAMRLGMGELESRVKFRERYGRSYL